MGIDLQVDQTVTEVVKNSENELILRTNKGQSFGAEKCIYAIGRKAKIEGLGLENLPGIN